MDKKSLSRTVLFFVALLLTNQKGFSNREIYTIGAAVKNINTEKMSNSPVANDNTMVKRMKNPKYYACFHFLFKLSIFYSVFKFSFLTYVFLLLSTARGHYEFKET